MKNFTKTFLVLALLAMTAMLVVSCDEPKDDKPTYTLAVPDVSVEQGSTATISPTLTASNSSATTGITITYASKDEVTGVSVTENTVTATTSAVVGESTWTATAKKGKTTVATKDFTITVTAGSVNPNVTYTLNDIATLSVAQGGDVTVVPVVTASDGSNTSAVTVVITKGDSTHAGLTIAGLKISAASTVPLDTYDFVATIQGTNPAVKKNFSVTVTAIAERDVLVTVTLGTAPEAALETGEYVWIAGNFYTGNTTWNSELMTEQPNKTWTTTLKVPGSFSTFYYKVYAVKSQTDNDWGVTNKTGEQLTTPDLTPGVLNITVDAWLNRPQAFDPDELFADPSFETPAGDDWTWSADSPWKIEGGQTFWPKGGDGRHGNAYCDGWSVSTNDVITLAQSIDATEKALTVGTVVTLSVYVFTEAADLTGYENGKLSLLCGAQTYEFAPQTGLSKTKWEQVNVVSHDFT